MRLFLDKYGQAEDVCAASRNTSHLGEGMYGTEGEDVGVALGVIVFGRYELTCDTGGGRDLVCIPQVGEDVEPVFTLFAKVRCKGFFWYGFAGWLTLKILATIRERCCMPSRESAWKAMSVKSKCCDAL